MTAPVHKAGSKICTGRAEIIMSSFFTPSTRMPHPKPLLYDGADIVAFVNRNADELLRIGRAAGGRNGRAAAAELVDTVMSRPDDIETIHDLVIVLRDALINCSGTGSSTSSYGRSDLDAAQRWFGARLDEFAARLA